MTFKSLKERVIDTGLCTSCGTCVGICPTSCISINESFEPQLFRGCNDCGLCLNFCPSMDFDFIRFRMENKKAKKDSFIGGYQNLYFGRTIDQQIRNKASGGGIVSTMLISALENRLIDGAIVARMDEEKIGRTRIVVAENRDDVLKAAQSKYIPVPINMILKEIKSRKGEFALVGLPCHIHAIRKLQADGPTWCADKIKFLVGLFCGSSLNSNFVDYILSIFNLKKTDVKELHFRYRRHPTTSSLLIATKDGKRFFLDRADYSWLFYLFAKEACQYCIDHTNEFADISVGDMRPFPTDSPNYRVIEPLQSVIIVRTEKGGELFRNTDNIDFSNYDIQDLIASKLTNMIDKKICSYTRMHLRRRRELPIPEFNQNLMGDYPLSYFKFKICPSKAFTASRYFYELSCLTIINLMQSKNAAKLLSKIPFQLLKTVVRRGYLRFKTRGFYYKINKFISIL